MAESTRRGDDAADDRLEGEEFDPATDDAVIDDEPDAAASRGGMATRERAEADPVDGQPRPKKDLERVGFFGRIGRFFREVVAELRKVIWPTRKELLTYTAVVVTFVAVMMSIVVLLDFGFAKGVLWVFGDPS